MLHSIVSLSLSLPPSSLSFSLTVILVSVRLLVVFIPMPSFYFCVYLHCCSLALSLCCYSVLKSLSPFFFQIPVTTFFQVSVNILWACVCPVFTALLTSVCFCVVLDGQQGGGVIDLVSRAVDLYYGADDDLGAQSVRTSISGVCDALEKFVVALENGEFDFDGSTREKLVSWGFDLLLMCFWLTNPTYH